MSDEQKEVLLYLLEKEEIAGLDKSDRYELQRLLNMEEEE